MKHSDSLSALNNALSIFQGQLKPVRRDSINPFFKSKYADLTAIWDNIREPLNANGLAVTQVTDVNEGSIVLITMLLHSSGQWISGEYLLTPVKTDPQAMGSALTYARRYALSAILGIVSDDDDDAEAATPHKEQRKEAKPLPATTPEASTPAQRKKIFATADQMGYKDVDVQAIMKKKFGVEHTTDLTKKQASNLISMIEQGETVKPGETVKLEVEPPEEKPE